MEALLRDGCAREIPDGNEVKAQRTWYVPHHSCNAAGKFRPLIFDFTKVNFDFTNTLLGVLLRFRQGKVAFTGDIKSMFFQVKVDPRDCDSLRFLWWLSNDLLTCSWLPIAGPSVSRDVFPSLCELCLEESTTTMWLRSVQMSFLLSRIFSTLIASNPTTLMTSLSNLQLR